MSENDLSLYFDQFSSLDYSKNTNFQDFTDSQLEHESYPLLEIPLSPSNNNSFIKEMMETLERPVSVEEEPPRKKQLVDVTFKVNNKKEVQEVNHYAKDIKKVLDQVPDDSVEIEKIEDFDTPKLLSSKDNKIMDNFERISLKCNETLDDFTDESDNSKETNEEEDLIDESILDFTYKTELIMNPITDNFGDTFLKHTIFKKDVLNILQSPMSSGKTTALKEFIRKNNFKKVLHVTNRILLANDISKKFDVKNYQNFKGYITEDDGSVVVTINSIGRIKNIECYDLVVLDEFSSTVDVLVSSIIKNAKFACNTLKDLIFGTRRTVIIMDALLSHRDLVYIKDCMIDSGNFDMQINNFKNNSKSHLNFRGVYLYDCLTDCLKGILTDAKNGKKVVVFTNTNNYLKKIIGLIKCNSPEIRKLIDVDFNTNNIDISYFDKDSKKELTKLLDNNFKDYKSNITVITPVLSSGISIDLYEVDKVYQILSPFTGSTTNMVQMMGRFRKIKSKSISVCLVTPEEVKLPDIKGLFEKSQNENTSNYNDHFHYLRKRFGVFYDKNCSIRSSIENYKNHMKNLILNEYKDVYETINNFPKKFIQTIKRNHDSIQIHNFGINPRRNNNDKEIGIRKIRNFAKKVDKNDYFMEDINGDKIKVVCSSINQMIELGIIPVKDNIVTNSKIRIESSLYLIDMPSIYQFKTMIKISSDYNIIFDTLNEKDPSKQEENMHSLMDRKKQFYWTFVNLTGLLNTNCYGVDFNIPTDFEERLKNLEYRILANNKALIELINNFGAHSGVTKLDILQHQKSFNSKRYRNLCNNVQKIYEHIGIRYTHDTIPGDKIKYKSIRYGEYNKEEINHKLISINPKFFEENTINRARPSFYERIISDEDLFNITFDTFNRYLNKTIVEHIGRYNDYLIEACLNDEPVKSIFESRILAHYDGLENYWFQETSEIMHQFYFKFGY